MKPDIVFFGEMLPEKFYKYPVDTERADFLLILGTSLEVNVNFCPRKKKIWSNHGNLRCTASVFLPCRH